MGYDDLRTEVSTTLRNAIRKRRLTLSEVSEVEAKFRQTAEALEPHRQSAFSVTDLLGALHEAGYEADDYAGDPAVFFADTPMLQKDKADFYVRVSHYAPRYANCIFSEMRWSDVACAYWWDAKEIARKAA